jgi:hypothetical protein
VTAVAIIYSGRGVPAVWQEEAPEECYDQNSGYFPACGA